jgi:hypothetical protein
MADIRVTNVGVGQNVLEYMGELYYFAEYVTDDNNSFFENEILSVNSSPPFYAAIGHIEYGKLALDDLDDLSDYFRDVYKIEVPKKIEAVKRALIKNPEATFIMWDDGLIKVRFLNVEYIDKSGQNSRIVFEFRLVYSSKYYSQLYRDFPNAVANTNNKIYTLIRKHDLQFTDSNLMGLGSKMILIEDGTLDNNYNGTVITPIIAETDSKDVILPNLVPASERAMISGPYIGL